MFTKQFCIVWSRHRKIWIQWPEKISQALQKTVCSQPRWWREYQKNWCWIFGTNPTKKFQSLEYEENYHATQRNWWWGQETTWKLRKFRSFNFQHQEKVESSPYVRIKVDTPRFEKVNLNNIISLKEEDDESISSHSSVFENFSPNFIESKKSSSDRSSTDMDDLSDFTKVNYGWSCIDKR